MNKYQQYKQIRLELASSCDKELRSIAALLEGGIISIVSKNAVLEIGSPTSTNVTTESGHILREELRAAAQVILERYRHNLQKEIVALGLQDLCSESPFEMDGTINNGKVNPALMARKDGPASESEINLPRIKLMP